MHFAKTLLLASLFIGSTSTILGQPIPESIVDQGLVRNFTTDLPASYNGLTPHPVLIILHGGGSDGNAFRSNSFFDEIADTRALITVFPDAYEGQWADL